MDRTFSQPNEQITGEKKKKKERRHVSQSVPSQLRVSVCLAFIHVWLLLLLLFIEKKREYLSSGDEHQKEKEEAGKKR